MRRRHGVIVGALMCQILFAACAGSTSATATQGIEPTRDAISVAEIGRAELPGVRVVDDSSLVVTLSESVPDFPMLLADPVAAVLKHENVAQWGSVFANGEQPTLLLRDHIEQPETPLGTKSGSRG